MFPKGTDYIISREGSEALPPRRPIVGEYSCKRIVSTPFPTHVGTWLGIALPILTLWGFPEFTSFFNPNYFGKLRYTSFEFAVAISAY